MIVARPLAIFTVSSPAVAVDAATPKAAAMIGSLINARWGAGKRTIITTNLDPKSFVTRYGTRITDRLRSSGVTEAGKPRWWVKCMGDGETYVDEKGKRRAKSMRGRVAPQAPELPPACEEEP